MTIGEWKTREMFKRYAITDSKDIAAAIAKREQAQAVTFALNQPFAYCRSTVGSWHEDDFVHVRRLADQLAVAFFNVRLNEEREELHWGALTALARAIDASSSWTAGHSERMTELAINIGRAMGLSQKELLILNRGGLLHDVGTIGTPPGILENPGRLDAQELKIMRDHVRMGLRILEPIPGFKEELLIVAEHHEWFDGSGYPAGLAGENISLFGRIFAVADCFDALISDRPTERVGNPF